MATISDLTTIPCTNATAAQFRAWAQFIHDSIVLGLVNTADTGQIDLTTVAAPAASNASMGYKIYRFDDTLQATAPIFVKVEFGCAFTVTLPSIWITIGTGTDGAGTITGTLFIRTQRTVSGTANAGPFTCLGSAGPARWCCAMWVTAGINLPSYYSIERTVNSAGVDNSDGVVLTFCKATNDHLSYFIPYSGVAPAVETGLHALLSGANPTAFGINVGVSLVIPMAGLPKQPPMNTLICKAGDFVALSTLLVPVYGTTRTYQHLGNGYSTLRNNGTNVLADPNSRLCMRYE